MGILCNYLTELFTKKGIIEECKKDIYKYGFEILFSSIINILLILISGLIFNAFLESVLFLVIIIPLRLYTGGYHADTYLKCNIVFLMIFLSIEFTYRIVQANYYIDYGYIPMIFLSELIIFKFSPIENKNKQLSIVKKQRYKKISIIISISICLLILLLIFFNSTLYLFITLILFASSLLMIIPIFERRIKNEK